MRLEHDSLGSLEVPNFAYYGIQTERNRQAFDISDLTLEDFPSFIEAVAKLKRLNKQPGKSFGETLIIRFRFVFTAVPELL